jgi:ubiquinone/menaquinone biosynthesis C-methylase UbiE
MASSHQSKEREAFNSLSPESAICSYEGSTYRSDFWTQNRKYEDAVERIALGVLLPSSGHRLIEIGAGFGRLVDLYKGYDQVVLFDYSRSMLSEARTQWGEAAPSGRPRYIYVAGDFNSLPFVDGLFDVVTMIRTIHHAPDVPHVLQGIGDITAPGGTFVLEFANKRHLKAIGRWLLHKQAWSPFQPEPYEFAELNFDFHPHWMQTQLDQAGFKIRALRTVSHFRVEWLKHRIPTQLLVKFDSLLQPTGRWWQLTPSVFAKSQVALTKPPAPEHSFFRCPMCRSTHLIEQRTAVVCKDCSRAWTMHNGLYDFKEPL